jgi:hypothetical protein
MQVGRQARRGSFLVRLSWVRRCLHSFRAQLSFQERNTRVKLNSECMLLRKKNTSHKRKSFFLYKKKRYTVGIIACCKRKQRLKNKIKCTNVSPALPLYNKIITLSTKKKIERVGSQYTPQSTPPRAPAVPHVRTAQHPPLNPANEATTQVEG